MGKFSGVLLASDYDNTLLNTGEAYRTGTPVPDIPARNLEALAYFTGNGGRFAMATGRAVAAMEKWIDQIPVNAPAIVCNGAALYEFREAAYLELITLEGEIFAHCEAALERFPTTAVEVYPLENVIHAVRPNQYTRKHEKLTFVSVREDASLSDVPGPITKLMFEDDRRTLLEVQAYLAGQPGAEAYGIFFTAETLLEVTRKDATKGNMVRRLAERLGIAPEHVYCAGDEINDISMLAMAAEGFAPANCAPAVRASGATIVSHVDQGALADIVEILDRRY